MWFICSHELDEYLRIYIYIYTWRRVLAFTYFCIIQINFSSSPFFIFIWCWEKQLNNVRFWIWRENLRIRNSGSVLLVNTAVSAPHPSAIEEHVNVIIAKKVFGKKVYGKKSWYFALKNPVEKSPFIFDVVTAKKVLGKKASGKKS